LSWIFLIGDIRPIEI